MRGGPKERDNEEGVLEKVKVKNLKEKQKGDKLPSKPL